MSQNSRLISAVVLFSALAIGLSPAVAVAAQGRGHGKKAEKAEDKREKEDDKRDKKDDKRDDKADRRHDRHDDRGDDRHDRRDDRRDNRAPVVVVDRDGHVRVIREYAHGGSLPPGLAKRESLPPGLRNQLRERGVLPPGLQKRLVPVPAALVTRFPPVPAYYTRYFAGDDFIVVDTRTNRIVTVVRDVWR